MVDQKYHLMQEYFLKDNVGDYVIEGEGEKTYRDFIEYKLGKIEIRRYKRTSL